MSTFKKIFKRKYTNNIKRRYTRTNPTIVINKLVLPQHVIIEDGCNKTSTDQLDFKVL